MSKAFRNRARSARFAVSAVLLGAACAWAAPPFQVSSTDDAVYPAVAGGGEGRFLVVWRSVDVDNQIAARFVAGGDPEGGDFTVNTSSGLLEEPDVARLPATNQWAVVWQRYSALGMDAHDIMGKVYDDAGTVAAAEHFVNDSLPFSQLRPAVGSGGGSGRFTIWKDHGTFPATLRAEWGSPPAEFVVSSGGDYLPDVGVANAGGGAAVVVWVDPDASDHHVIGRRFTAPGAGGPEFQISTTPVTSGDPAVAVTPTGAFTAAWVETDSPGEEDVMARRYDAAGTPITAPFQVNTTTPGRQWEPAIAADAADNVMVVWQQNDWGEIRARRYASGLAWAPEFIVAAPGFNVRYSHPDVAADATGNFLVTWNQSHGGAGVPYGVFARQYLACTPAGDPDVDAHCGADDNCVTTYNLDQQDTDGTDGGDLCDVCPGAANSACNPALSGAATIGPAGGVMLRGNVALSAPAGAVDGDTSFSITGGLVSSEYGLGNVGLSGAPVLDIVKLGPEGVVFNPPVNVSFVWADAFAPFGVEDTRGISESNLRVYQNGVAITHRCGDPECTLPGCTTGTTCGLGPLTGRPGLCCDPSNTPAGNRWTVPLWSFSELVLAEDPCAEPLSCAAPQPNAGLLQLVDKADDATDTLVWKFTGAAPGTVGEFGDPVSDDGTSYALCLYDVTTSPPATIGRVVIPAGGTCDGKPCWKAAGSSGFKYKRKDGAPEGATTLVLKAGTRVKATLKGKGTFLRNRFAALPAPPLGSPPLPALRAQLRGRNGQCWEAEYPAPIVNQAGRFMAKPVVPATTTTTSTSTTTTTLQFPPCGDAAYPQCDGSCPNVGEYCEGTPSFCFCRSYACGWPGSPCLGECAAGGVCVVDGGGCTCEAGSQPCAGASGPECDGTCGPFEFCHHDGSGGCACAPLGCDVIGVPPQCTGECPAGEACRDVGGACACMP